MGAQCIWSSLRERAWSLLFLSFPVVGRRQTCWDGCGYAIDIEFISAKYAAGYQVDSEGSTRSSRLLAWFT